MEEVASQMGMSPKTPFRFTQLSRSPSICSSLLEHWLVHSTTPDDWMQYCIHIRVTLKEGKGDQPSSSDVWSGSLISSKLQEACPGDQITKPIVLVPGEAVLFLGRCSLQEGFLYNNVWDVELSLNGLVSWAGRTVQGETTVNTVQEDHQSIMDPIMEMKMKVRGPGHPWESRRATWSSAAACNINDWMQGPEEGVTEREVGRTDCIETHSHEQGHTHSQHIGGGRWQRQQGMPGVPRHFWGGSPSSWDGCSDHESAQSSLHSTIFGASSRSNKSAYVGRGSQVKINLPIFKDEKSKDAVTYCSWWWDVAIFHQSGWDDQHLLLYIYHLLLGFLGDLTRSLGEDATLNNVLQTIDKHYCVIMTCDALSKELYSLKHGSR